MHPRELHPEARARMGVPGVEGSASRWTEASPLRKAGRSIISLVRGGAAQEQLDGDRHAAFLEEVAQRSSKEASTQQEK
jgi:hypothetical protein